MPSDDLDVFAVEQDVEVRRSSGWGWVLLALVGAGVLVAVVVVIVSALVTIGQPESTTSVYKSDQVCGGEDSCSDLSLEQISQLVALALPAGSEVVTSRYEETDTSIVVEARVVLPEGSGNPFEGSAYFAVSAVDTTFPAGIVPIDFYAATGESGTLNADAVLGAGDDGREIVAVRLQRDL